eukprot:gene27078-2310_t
MLATSNTGRMAMQRSLMGRCMITPGRSFVKARTAGPVRQVASKAAEGDQQYDFDIFTIGAGSGGVRGSRFASSYGARVAVCELPFAFISSDTEGGVGGTCVLRGCVPKKLMVYASEYADAFKDSAGFGWDDFSSPKYSLSKFMTAKRKELQRLNTAYNSTLSNAKVTLLEGRGKVTGPHEVEVDGKKYTAGNIIIAVGGKPTKLDIPGKELCITSDEVLDMDELPNTPTVYRSAPASAASACGFDNDCRSFLAEQYNQAGMKLHPETTPVEVTKQADGKLTLVIKDKDGNNTPLTDIDVVVMATGRSPKVQGLGLEDVGVKLGKKGEVLVDDYSRTNIPSIWAVGDVTDRINLTPVALMEGMALAKTIVLNEPTKPDYDAVASAVFSHPELATVGLNEEDALKAGHNDLDIFSSNFRPMRNTISGNPLRAMMKMVVDANTDKVLGIHMVGDHSAEIMQGFAVAMKMGATKSQVDSVIGVHPSSAEELVTMRSPSKKIRGGVAA